MNIQPALNVVVYRQPGPGDNVIERHAGEFVKRKSVFPTGGGLGYLVLVPAVCFQKTSV